MLVGKYTRVVFSIPHDRKRNGWEKINARAHHHRRIKLVPVCEADLHTQATRPPSRWARAGCSMKVASRFGSPSP